MAFIYSNQRHPQQQEYNVNSSIQSHIKQENAQTAQKTANKTLILHHSTTKSKQKAKQTNRDKGLTYSIGAYDFQVYEALNGSRMDRSLKIDCSGPADILTTIQNLNWEYIPKRKKAGVYQYMPQSQIKLKFIKTTAKREIQQKNNNNPCQSKELWQSWDKLEQRQKALDMVCTIIFLIILLSISSHKIRQGLFGGYSSIRANAN